MAKSFWKHILTVRQHFPLVHNITNFVVMNNSANALLAVGASPIMAHAHSEVEEMVSICQSLVINMGTLDEYSVKSMLAAAGKAKELDKPWILDPAGVGATSYRSQVLNELVGYQPTVIRGNASEILSLAQTSNVYAKGVDSSANSHEAVHAAKEIHQKYGSIVCVSGETDIVVGYGRQTFIYNGNALMTKVTGLGCSSTAVIGAFIAVIDDVYEAVCAATALFGICGELAATQSNGPGTLQLNILDKLYNITEQEFAGALKISENE